MIVPFCLSISSNWSLCFGFGLGEARQVAKVWKNEKRGEIVCELSLWRVIKCQDLDGWMKEIRESDDGDWIWRVF